MSDAQDVDQDVVDQDVVDQDVDEGAAPDADQDADDDVEYEEGDVNEAPGSVSKSVLDYLARNIVDDPDAVEVESDGRGNRVDLRLHVAPDDMGKIIGKRGRVAQAIRTIVRAAGAREGVEASVDIVD